jgi:hypothetical protein
MKIPNEIVQYILKQANHPIWKMPGVLSSFKNKNRWFDVFKVTSTGLIFIHGNSETGWEHILQRHNKLSNRLYFGKKKNFPSKFNIHLVPINDFPNVADDVFINGTIDMSKQVPEFEKYIGLSDKYTRATEKKKFHLVLYKGTKIVHSLYPDESLEKPISLLDDRIHNTIGILRIKCEIKAIQQLKYKDIYEIQIPYGNAHEKVRYAILFLLDMPTGVMKIGIQVNNRKGKRIRIEEFGMHQLPLPIDIQKLLWSLGEADLTPIEERIKEIELTEFEKMKTRCADWNFTQR